MIQYSSISLDETDEGCPVPLVKLGQIYRAEADALPGLLADLPEATRARLAVYLYGRSHTHELGIRVAATCEGASLRRTAGLLGNALHDLSRRPYQSPSYGNARVAASRRISLGGTPAATQEPAASA